jgi:hypothetical protein
MTGPPTKDRRRGASTPRPSSDLIREAEHYTAPAPPRGMTNWRPSMCWICGLRVKARAGIFTCPPGRYVRGSGLVAHRPDPGATGTVAERLASGCPGPPVIQVLAPGQRGPRRKVAA